MVADYAGDPHKKNVQFCTVNSGNWRKIATTLLDLHSSLEGYRLFATVRPAYNSVVVKRLCN
jgi:hypothetical protein